MPEPPALAEAYAAGGAAFAYLGPLLDKAGAKRAGAFSVSRPTSTESAPGAPDVMGAVAAAKAAGRPLVLASMGTVATGDNPHLGWHGRVPGPDGRPRGLSGRELCHGAWGGVFDACGAAGPGEGALILVTLGPQDDPLGDLVPPPNAICAPSLPQVWRCVGVWAVVGGWGRGGCALVQSGAGLLCEMRGGGGCVLPVLKQPKTVTTAAPPKLDKAADPPSTDTPLDSDGRVQGVACAVVTTPTNRRSRVSAAVESTIPPTPGVGGGWEQATFGMPRFGNNKSAPRCATASSCPRQQPRIPKPRNKKQPQRTKGPSETTPNHRGQCVVLCHDPGIWHRVLRWVVMPDLPRTNSRHPKRRAPLLFPPAGTGRWLMAGGRGTRAEHNISTECPPPPPPGAAVSAMSSGKPHESQDLQTWSFGSVARP